jgi:hypothetical protein
LIARFGLSIASRMKTFRDDENVNDLLNKIEQFSNLLPKYSLKKKTPSKRKKIEYTLLKNQVGMQLQLSLLATKCLLSNLFERLV